MQISVFHLFFWGARSIDCNQNFVRARSGSPIHSASFAEWVLSTSQPGNPLPPRSRIAPTPYLCEAPPLPPDAPPPLFDGGGAE